MMGALAIIIAAISADVVDALADAGYPALVDGGIVVGTAAEYEQLAPPRIIFDPSPGSNFGAAEYASASATLDTIERRNQRAMRTIAAEDLIFDVHCWGAAPGSTNPVDDYDVTRALVHQVRATLQDLFPGAHKVEDGGKYRTGANAVRLGRWYTFGVTILTPVLDRLAPYAAQNYGAAQLAADVVNPRYAPSDTTGEGTVTMVAPDGTEEGLDP